MEMATIVSNLIKLYYNSGLRGCTRSTFFLAKRVKSLQSVPVKIYGDSVLFADLRLLSSHAVFLGWETDIEEEALFREILLPGETAFDIGAHIGLYSIYLSKIVGKTGKVFSFELSSDVIPALTKTLNLLSNVTLLPCGLSNKNEEAVLFVPEDPAGASLADRKDLNTKPITCELRRLDDLVTEKIVSLPDLIKCDVEGAEELVFRGAVDLLNTENAPIIYFENNRKASEGFGFENDGAFEFLKSLKKPLYSFYLFSRSKLSPLNLIPEPEPGNQAVNILAVPVSKIQRIEKFLEKIDEQNSN